MSRQGIRRADRPRKRLPKELIQLPKYGQSRLYERVALAVSIAAVLVIGVTAASDDAEAQKATTSAAPLSATIPTAPGGAPIPEPAAGEMLTPATNARGGGVGSGGSGSGGGGKDGRQSGKHVFPLPARHTYGDGFGAGRSHQGQDIFAKCGKKIVAARGGKVQYSGYHPDAGNYVVIDGTGTDWDYIYMHMKKKGIAKDGARVGTGDLVGFNSDTGNASGCHLHFEMWDPSGWYEGGRAKAPTKFLKSWDRYS